MTTRQLSAYENHAITCLRDRNYDGAKVYALLRIAEALEAVQTKGTNPGGDVA